MIQFFVLIYRFAKHQKKGETWQEGWKMNGWKEDRGLHNKGEQCRTMVVENYGFGKSGAFIIGVRCEPLWGRKANPCTIPVSLLYKSCHFLLWKTPVIKISLCRTASIDMILLNRDNVRNPAKNQERFPEFETGLERHRLTNKFLMLLRPSWRNL